MRISDWSSDVCSSDLWLLHCQEHGKRNHVGEPAHEDGDLQCGGGCDEPTQDTADGEGGVPETSVGAVALGELALSPVHGKTVEEVRLVVTRPEGQATGPQHVGAQQRSEEHPSELQSLMRNPYAVF